MLFTCLIIFGARILDVSIATLRTMIMVKKKSFITPILAFLEVFIWFIAARRALNTDLDSIMIPISYALGYATGTYLGGILARKIVKNYNRVEVISYRVKDILAKLREDGYVFSLLRVENTNNLGKKKDLILIDVRSKNTKKLIKTVKEIDEKAYITIKDIKQIINGYIKE